MSDPVNIDLSKHEAQQERRDRILDRAVELVEDELKDLIKEMGPEGLIEAIVEGMDTKEAGLIVDACRDGSFEQAGRLLWHWYRQYLHPKASENALARAEAEAEK